jgi:predicted phosphodiesterase
VFPACESMFEFSPYDAKVSTTDVNNKNIQSMQDTHTFDDTVHIAIFSDSHSYYDNLRDAVSFINNLPNIDFVAVIGDVTEAGLARQYEWYLSEMSNLKMPFITVIGNHDYLSNGSTVYRKLFGPTNFLFVYAGYRFVGFDDVVWENNNNSPDFPWLSSAVQAPDTNARAVILSHIPPSSCNELGENDSKIFEIIAETNHVILSVSGHSHEYRDHTKNDVIYLSTESVCSRGITLVHLYNEHVRIERINY